MYCKLKKEGSNWIANTCVGNNFLEEINASQMKDSPKAKIISQINQLINQYYIFMGYRELGNFIKKKIQVPSDGLTLEQQKNMELQKIKQTFNNRLIIVDEIHNLISMIVGNGIIGSTLYRLLMKFYLIQRRNYLFIKRVFMEQIYTMKNKKASKRK